MFKKFKAGKTIRTKVLRTGVTVKEIQRNGCTEIVVPHNEFIPFNKLSEERHERYVQDHIKVLAAQEATRIANVN